MPEPSFNILRMSNHKQLREAGSILKDAFSLILFNIKAGKKLRDLDRLVAEFLRKNNAMATTRLLGFPYQFSACLNEEVVNGFPSNQIISEGDLVTIDMGMFAKGVFVDKALTIIVPPITGKKKYLVHATSQCLKAGIAAATDGNTNISVGAAVEFTAKYYGMTASPRFWGHGIGEAHHMEPVIPNINTTQVKESVLTEGQSIAVEPIIFFESSYQLHYKDQTIVSDSLSAHMEDTIIIHKGEAEVVT
jgi:methionyl aminopeptidase